MTTSPSTEPISATPTPKLRVRRVGVQFRIAKSHTLLRPMAA